MSPSTAADLHRPIVVLKVIQKLWIFYQLELGRACPLPLLFIDVTTLQGRLITRLSEVLERSSGMTLSRLDLVLSGRVRSVQQRKAIPFVA